MSAHPSTSVRRPVPPPRLRSSAATSVSAHASAAASRAGASSVPRAHAATTGARARLSLGPGRSSSYSSAYATAGSSALHVEEAPTTARQRRKVRTPKTRPVLQVPSLSLVPNPAPGRGFTGTILACLVLFFGAFGVVFALNMSMVSAAYEVQSLNKEINSVLAQKETLENQVVSASTTRGLTERAQQLGLVQASDVRYLDIATGTMLDPKQLQAQQGK